MRECKIEIPSEDFYNDMIILSTQFYGGVNLYLTRHYYKSVKFNEEVTYWSWLWIQE